jgi:hypothetical protein
LMIWPSWVRAVSAETMLGMGFDRFMLILSLRTN